MDRHILTDIFDAVNQNTRATGHWKKPPDFPFWPRPSSTPQTEEKKPESLLRSLFEKLARR